MILETIKLLLPQARAWSITVNKRLRQFFEGLATTFDAYVAFIGAVWQEIFPFSTTQLDRWENQFGLIYNESLPDADRRAAIDAEWKAVGGQSAEYIQGILRTAGFDVFVYESFNPGRWPPTFTPPDPFTPGHYYNPADLRAGQPNFYPLVNRFVYDLVTTPAVQAGSPTALAGRPEAQAGRPGGTAVGEKIYVIDDDPALFPYWLYIAGDDPFSAPTSAAQVPNERRLEFESLLLKICPTHLWLGVNVEYI